MKTKTYVFTEIEQKAIRESLTKYYHNVSKKFLDPLSGFKCSPYAEEMHKAVIGLREQF